MNKKVTILLILLTLTNALFSNEERNKWRISISPEINFNLKAKIGINNSKILEYIPNKPISLYSNQQVLNDILGTYDPYNIKRYANGAWINPNDSRNSKGTTWNYYIPEAETLNNDNVISLSAEKQFNNISHYSLNKVSDGLDKEEFNAPGINFDVTREIYYNENYRCGIDLIFGISWFFKRNCIKNAEDIYYERYDNEIHTYIEDFDVSYLADEEGIGYNYDGSLGHGEYYNAGPILRLDMSSIRDMLIKKESVYHSLSYSIKGDYNEFEFITALRPFWELYDWLRLYGTFGIGLSYVHFSYNEYIYTNNTESEHIHGSEDDFDFYGISGVGLCIKYKQLLIGADVDYRLAASDVDVHSRYLYGSLERSNIFGRIYIGFEF